MKQKEDFRKHNVNIIEETIEQGKCFKSAKKKFNTEKTQMTDLLEEDGRIVRRTSTRVLRKSILKQPQQQRGQNG